MDSDGFDEEPKICLLPLDENECISEEEDIDDNSLYSVVPAYVEKCTLFSKRLSIAETSKETITDPHFF